MTGYTILGICSNAGRTGLAEALEQPRWGDSLVVWRLDRLRRDFRYLIDTLIDLEQRGLRALRAGPLRFVSVAVSGDLHEPADLA